MTILNRRLYLSSVNSRLLMLITGWVPFSLIVSNVNARSSQNMFWTIHNRLPLSAVFVKFSHFVILLWTRDEVAAVSFFPGVLGAFLLSALG